MEKIEYLGQPNCYRLSNGTIEVIVATDIGPRVLLYGFVGGQNVFAEVPELKVETDLGEWKPWGGHRLWAAPEGMPRSYAPDNGPVKFIVDEEDSIRLIGPIEPGTGLQKEIALWLDPQGTKVTVEHSITNHNLWEIELAPWALTIVSGGGTTILPQEPYRSHDDYLLPARPMVLWHFTDLSDSRWRWGKKFVCLRSDASKDEPQKIGAGNRQGWAGYWKAGTLFMKSFPYLDDADYPDLGCNCETYTAGSFMEIETLGPLARLTPGESAVHVEEWRLFDNIDIGASEDTLEAALADALSAIA